MTTLIGLHGRRGAGKDTAFGFLHEWAAERGVTASRRGFADALKLSFARLFIPNISLEEAVLWCDELKAPPGSQVMSTLAVTWGKGDEFKTWTEIKHEISGRQALQRYGTEGHRDVFGDDFWVDALLPTNTLEGEEDAYRIPAWPLNFRGPLSAEPPDIAVITDVRFDNEAKRIKQLGGQIWEVFRGPGEFDSHVSEQELSEGLVDVSISNESTLECFRERVVANAEARIKL